MKKVFKTSKFQPKLIVKYIDDLLIILKKVEQLLFLCKLNVITPKMKFSVDTQKIIDLGREH